MASSISKRNEELESYFPLILFRKVCVSKAFIHPPVNAWVEQRRVKNETTEKGENDKNPILFKSAPL